MYYNLVFFRIPGPDLKNCHPIGYGEEGDPEFCFPSNWCLGPLVNGICETPAAVAAMKFTQNPLVQALL